MLILRRKQSQGAVVIAPRPCDLRVVLVETTDNESRLGFDAPNDVIVLRDEVYRHHAARWGAGKFSCDDASAQSPSVPDREAARLSVLTKARDLIAGMSGKFEVWMASSEAAELLEHCGTRLLEISKEVRGLS